MVLCHFGVSDALYDRFITFRVQWFRVPNDLSPQPKLVGKKKKNRTFFSG